MRQRFACSRFDVFKQPKYVNECIEFKPQHQHVPRLNSVFVLDCYIVLYIYTSNHIWIYLMLVYDISFDSLLHVLRRIFTISSRYILLIHPDESTDSQLCQVVSPWQRSSSASPVTSKTGIGFFTHIAVSMLCLVPYLKTQCLVSDMKQKHTQMIILVGWISIGLGL